MFLQAEGEVPSLLAALRAFLCRLDNELDLQVEPPGQSTAVLGDNGLYKV